MNTRPKLSGPEFMKKVSPKQTGSIIKFPETKEIFFALIEARGLEVNAGHLRPASDNPAMNEIYAKTARINAIKSSMKIRSNSSDVTDSHYVDVALDAPIQNMKILPDNWSCTRKCTGFKIRMSLRSSNNPCMFPKIGFMPETLQRIKAPVARGFYFRRLFSSVCLIFAGQPAFETFWRFY